MIRNQQCRTGLPNWIFLLSLCCLVGGFSVGCSKKAPPEDTAESDDEEEESEDASGAGDQASGGGKSRPRKPPKSPEIGGVPKDVWPDVWFDDPLSVVSNNAAVAPTGPAAVATATPAPAAAPAAKPEAAPAPAGGQNEWSGLLSGEDITDETKSIKLKLTDALSTVGKYNGNYKDVIQVEAAELSALAAIAIKHPDAVGWKENAKYIRDLASEVSSNAKGLGQKDFEAAKAPFEKLNDLLSGNKPAGLEEAASEIAYSELFSRRPLMRRMDRAYQFLKSGVNNEASFKKEIDKVRREVIVLGVMTKVCGAEGYPSTDEEDYQAYVKTAVGACLEMLTAVKDENYTAFTDALGRAQRTCDECHPNYRTGD